MTIVVNSAISSGDYSIFNWGMGMRCQREREGEGEGIGDLKEDEGNTLGSNYIPG